MDYKGHLCPVCNNAFEKGDDVVVCPICGTPHHRHCYEETGHCVNLNRHRESYDYKRECEVNSSDDTTTTCQSCGAGNPPNSKYCNSCGNPIGADSTQKNPPKNNEDYQSFGASFAFDPLGGVKPEEDLGEGVKANEAAKYIRTSTPYYIPQFKQIKERGRSRFSLSAFLFGSIWMLYRKMYKLGILFTAFFALLTVGDLYISLFHSEAIKQVAELYNEMLVNMASGYGFNMYGAFGDFLMSLNTEQIIVMLASTFISVLLIFLRVICGIFANRWYYKHTLKSINKIKSESASDSEADLKLTAKGGVNLPLAISLMVSYYLIVYLIMII